MFTNDWQKSDGIDVKGLQSVRRDSCRLVREAQDACLRVLLYERDVDKAAAIVRNTVGDLVAGRVPLHKLILLKPIPANALLDDEDVVAALPKGKKRVISIAERVVRRMRARDSAWSAGAGQRIPLIMVATENVAEHVLTVMDEGLTVDNQWYLVHQLKNPLLQLFELVMPRPQSLFALTGTEIQVKKKTKMGSSMMQKFVKVRQRCRVCNGVVQSNREEGLCKNCSPMRKNLIQNQLAVSRRIEQESSECWDVCVACAGTQQMALKCRNVHCDRLFERHRIDEKLAQTTKALKGLQVQSKQLLF